MRIKKNRYVEKAENRKNRMEIFIWKTLLVLDFSAFSRISASPR